MMNLAQSCAVVDGVLIIKKDAGWTSHDVVAKVRHLLGGVKVGHAGTLDPAATGVLPVLIGRGTRIAEYLVEWDKEYCAVLRLGETTDTQDATGTVLMSQSTDRVTGEAINEAAARFRGPIEQVPPMYSAVKIAGVPLYKSARAGKTVARDARTVVIHTLEVLAIQGRDVTLRIACSKGTYVRTLCADMGEVLGVGGHMLALERRRVGPLLIEQALTIDEVVTRHALGRLGDDLLSLDRALDAFWRSHQGFFISSSNAFTHFLRKFNVRQLCVSIKIALAFASPLSSSVTSSLYVYYIASFSILRALFLLRSFNVSRTASFFAPCRVDGGRREDF
jgi:tRNA pseudouridine55 synthase